MKKYLANDVQQEQNEEGSKKPKLNLQLGTGSKKTIFKGESRKLVQGLRILQEDVKH